MKNLLLLLTAISIYDTTDPKRVLVEACREETCVKVVVPKADLEKEDLILRLSNLLESQLN